MPTEPLPQRLPHVQCLTVKGRPYLYYRRDGKRWPLPGPEGSPEFTFAYQELHAGYAQAKAHHTLNDAVAAYYKSADFQSLADTSRRQYVYYLDWMRERYGKLPLDVLDPAWINGFRDQLAEQPNFYNAVISRMRQVADSYIRQHPDAGLANHWQTARRIVVDEDSDQNRPWPDDVLAAIRHEATPEFRALVDALLLTGQRISDACRWGPQNYDRDNGTLVFRQGKTGKRVVLHVSEPLAQVFESQRGRSDDRLLVTPRNVPWTPSNAGETLIALRNRLNLERYTIHGLRATGPTALKMMGMDNRAIRELTGHDTDQNLEVYLRGVAGHSLAKLAAEALTERFSELLTKNDESANQRRFSGVTGRAARNAGRSASAGLPGKPVANWQTGKANPEKT